MKKKIINRKVYNTETAELIGKYWNGLSTNDFHYVYEELYITKKKVIGFCTIQVVPYQSMESQEGELKVSFL